MCEVWGRVKKRLPLLFCLWPRSTDSFGYNVLEDDYLRSLLKDGEGEKNPQEKEPEPKKTKKKKKSLWHLLSAAVIYHNQGAAVGIAVKLYIDNKNANSYDYQIEMAEKELVDQ